MNRCDGESSVTIHFQTTTICPTVPDPAPSFGAHPVGTSTRREQPATSCMHGFHDAGVDPGNRIDQSPFERSLRIDRGDRKGKCGATLSTDPTSDTDRTAGARNETEIDLRQADPGRRISDDVAREGSDLGTAAEGHAVDRHRCSYPQFVHQTSGTLSESHYVPSRRISSGTELPQVAAATERSSSSQDMDGFDRVVEQHRLGGTTPSVELLAGLEHRVHRRFGGKTEVDRQISDRSQEYSEARRGDRVPRNGHREAIDVIGADGQVCEHRCRGPQPVADPADDHRKRVGRYERLAGQQGPKLGTKVIMWLPLPAPLAPSSAPAHHSCGDAAAPGCRRSAQPAPVHATHNRSASSPALETAVVMPRPSEFREARQARYRLGCGSAGSWSRPRCRSANVDLLSSLGCSTWGCEEAQSA